jgi:TorA maturation chaperone TorD
MMGPAHVSALEWYAKYGTCPRADSDPADHAGLLLMFYAQLLVAGASREDLRAFGERHLTWVPAFAESFGREARHPFYRWLSTWIGELASAALRPA